MQLLCRCYWFSNVLVTTSWFEHLLFLLWTEEQGYTWSELLMLDGKACGIIWFSIEVLEFICCHIFVHFTCWCCYCTYCYIGVRQYKSLVEDGTLPHHNYDNKVKCLLKILTQCNFQQCLIFSNLMSRYVSDLGGFPNWTRLRYKYHTQVCFNPV